jgi:hypothetical protein
MSSVTVWRIAAGMLSNTRSINLPMIIANLGSVGAPGSCAAPRHSRTTSTAGLRHVNTKPTSFATASLPWCLVIPTQKSRTLA